MYIAKVCKKEFYFCDFMKIVEVRLPKKLFQLIEEGVLTARREERLQYRLMRKDNGRDEVERGIGVPVWHGG